MEKTARGQLSLPCGEKRRVFYPTPFVRPPSLNVTGGGGDFRVTAQDREYFEVENTRSLADFFTRISLRWVATGVAQSPTTDGAVGQTARPPASTVASVQSEAKSGRARGMNVSTLVIAVGGLLAAIWTAVQLYDRFAGSGH